MFFRDRIVSIKPGDRVLEIGPGGSPHPRADVFLEKRFADENEAEKQRGFTPPLRTAKPVVYYDNVPFPFRDAEFDYVICSHVIEHVEDVDAFVSEIARVGKRGYIEYPSIYFEFIYNIPEHLVLVARVQDTILWLPKREAGLARFAAVQHFFYDALKQGHTAMVDDLKEFLIQGFEWEGWLRSRKAQTIDELVFHEGEYQIPPVVKKSAGHTRLQRFAAVLKRAVNFGGRW